MFRGSSGSIDPMILPYPLKPPVTNLRESYLVLGRALCVDTQRAHAGSLRLLFALNDDVGKV